MCRPSRLRNARPALTVAVHTHTHTHTVGGLPLARALHYIIHGTVAVDSPSAYQHTTRSDTSRRCPRKTVNRLYSYARRTPLDIAVYFSTVVDDGRAHTLIHAQKRTHQHDIHVRRGIVHTRNDDAITHGRLLISVNANGGPALRRRWGGRVAWGRRRGTAGYHPRSGPTAAHPPLQRARTPPPRPPPPPRPARTLVTPARAALSRRGRAHADNKEPRAPRRRRRRPVGSTRSKDGVRCYRRADAQGGSKRRAIAFVFRSFYVFFFFFPAPFPRRL